MGVNHFPGPMPPRPTVSPSPATPPFRGPQYVRDPRTVARADLTLADVLLYEALIGSEEPDIISLDGGPE